MTGRGRGRHRRKDGITIPSVDSGIEMRMPTSFGVHSGSDSSRSVSPSHARRVIVVHRGGFEGKNSFQQYIVSGFKRCKALSNPRDLVRWN